MKALLVLAVLYVGAFLIAIQGASQTSAEASTSKSGVAHIDPTKEADIRSLMDLVGARAVVQDVATKGTQQIRENLIATMPAGERGQKFVDAFVSDYQKKFNPDDVAKQLVGIYDKHFTDDEIRGLLQFYGSPLGRKLAAETPKINAEIQAANHAVSTQVAKDVLLDLPSEYLGIGTGNISTQDITAQPAASKSRVTAQPRSAQGKRSAQTSALTQPQSMASASQP
jgi:uncharacterized protein